MKTITIQCPCCFKSFEYGISQEQTSKIFSLLTADKEFMFKMGQAAAKAYAEKLPFEKEKE